MSDTPTIPQAYKAILLFGPPGSGKGTQGRILANIPGYYHLSSGDLFRSINPHSELGKIFLEYSSQGLLVPDNYTVRLWNQHVEHLTHADQFNPKSDILILDGIPRNVAQAQLMEDYIEVKCLIHLQAASEEEMMARIHRRALRENRLDDASEEIIRQRMRAYEAETLPLLQHYPQEQIHTVEAGGKPIQVLSRIVDAIK
jgi:adenylate kinase